MHDRLDAVGAAIEQVGVPIGTTLPGKPIMTTPLAYIIDSCLSPKV